MLHHLRICFKKKNCYVRITRSKKERLELKDLYWNSKNSTKSVIWLTTTNPCRVCCRLQLAIVSHLRIVEKVNKEDVIGRK